MPHRPLPVGSKRTDRAYGNAGSAFATKATDRVWANNYGKSRAIGLRPADRPTC
jgi:hypothetical protein